MVRPYRGGKAKNIRSLILDVLDDGVRPTAICVHAATNDIGSGRSIDEVVGETEALIKLIKEKEAMPIISLPTLRADKFSKDIQHLTERLIQLCNSYEVHYIQHRAITKEHLNQGGLHISSRYTYLFTKNFSNCFNFLLDHK